MNKVLIIGLSVFLLFACKKDDVDALNQEEIEKFIGEHNLPAKSTGSGLYYVIDEEGTGDRPKSNSDVKVRYNGYFTDGKLFDQSTTGITFNLQGVIDGWTEGIPLFKEGGKGMLLIPSKLGYGDRSVGSIPPNSVLIFDIELMEVIN
ncbi:MAG: peptidylprolyl isomerase [Bacteroidetes bacterium]|nr:MAG: peptidylprolyl isomerase [Bacteroidota bacterium]